MPRRRNRLNRGHSVPIFVDRFGSSIASLRAKIEETKNIVHRGGKGDEREVELLKVINGLLPDIYKAVKGEVVDLGKRTSPQLDIMIYDSSRNFPFYSGDTAVLPAEALLASIEVKSVLNSDAIEKSQIAAGRLRELRPFKKPQALSGRFGIEGDARYFHTLFAYDTTFEGSDWARKVCDKVIAAKPSNFEGVEMIYVLGKGLLQPARRRFLIEDESTAQALTAFWVSMFNFIGRESPRRKPVPYISYAATINKLWTKV